MFKKPTIYLYVACLIAVVVPSASADLFLFGDFAGTDVMYLDVQEDTRLTPHMLFGAPEITGNKLDFDPTSFTAAADGNTPSHTTDAQLNFTLMSNANNFGIDKVMIEENGDFTLVGLSSAEAVATVGAVVNFTVTHINGAPAVVPDGQAIMTFTPDAGGSFELSDEGPSTATPWSGMLDVDIAGFLADNMIGGLATKVEFSIDNTLTAAAANGGSAFIAKKDFNADVTVVVPEPSSLALLSGMLLCLAGLSRKSA